MVYPEPGSSLTQLGDALLLLEAGAIRCAECRSPLPRAPTDILGGISRVVETTGLTFLVWGGGLERRVARIKVTKGGEK